MRDCCLFIVVGGSTYPFVRVGAIGVFSGQGIKFPHLVHASTIALDRKASETAKTVEIKGRWPLPEKSRTSATPSLTFRFLFAYHDHDPGFPGPTVGRHEFAPRSKQRGNTVVTETLGAA